MSNINNWNFDGEDTEPLETTEKASKESTKSQEVAEELDIKATIKEENDDKVAEENNVIGSKTTGSKGKKKKSALTPNASGVISSGSVVEEPKKSAAPKKPKKERIAVFSTKNVTWSGVGKVYRGYNIVTQEQADRWVTRDHIRLATPEEIAQEFGE